MSLVTRDWPFASLQCCFHSLSPNTILSLHSHPKPSIIPTTRQTICASSQILAHPLSANLQRLTVLQHKQHARPFRLAWVLPRMHRCTLHSHVAALHELPFAVVEDQLNRAFE